MGQRVGLTCAACHTSNVTVLGKTVRIDGGAGHFDFDSFYGDLAVAVARTFFDPAAFDRFAARVLSQEAPEPTATAGTTRQIIEPKTFESFTERTTSTNFPGPLPKDLLRLSLAEFQSRIAGDAMIRRPVLRSGFGRVDALTQIVNSISTVDQDNPHNLRPVAAPTSYPHLWLAPQLEFVQWNPVAANPLGRNGAEVLGVFGSATLTGDPANWYKSSILVRELHMLETWVQRLKPPPWDEVIFGSIDRVLVKQGRALYRKHCDGCHTSPPYRRTKPGENRFKKTFIKITPIPYKKVKTDPLYVESLARRIVRTNAATFGINGGKPIVPAASYFLKTAKAIVGRAMNDLQLSDKEQAAMIGFRVRPDGKSYEPDCFSCLKAGPLAGIWATGPYLHNGSVPTIYELLSPVSERQKIFWTGGRELDLKKLGFLSDDAPDRFRFDTSLPGNQNIGHLYPPQGLSHDERMSIIEYLKLLSAEVDQ